MTAFKRKLNGLRLAHRAIRAGELEDGIGHLVKALRPLKLTPRGELDGRAREAVMALTDDDLTDIARFIVAVQGRARRKIPRGPKAPSRAARRA